MATERSYDRLNAGALGVVSLAIVVAIGAIVLANMQPASLQTEDLGTEAFQPSTPLPSNVTVSEASNNDFVRVVEDSETLVFEDTSAGTNTTLTVDTDYVPFYDEGTFEIQDTSAKLINAASLPSPLPSSPSIKPRITSSKLSAPFSAFIRSNSRFVKSLTNTGFRLRSRLSFFRRGTNSNLRV